MLLPLLLLASVAAPCLSHDFSMGACPAVRPQRDIDLDKFLGLWYVVAQTDTESECFTLNFERTSPTTLSVTKDRQHPGLRGVGLQRNRYTGTIDIPHGDDQGRLRLKWPLNVLGKNDFFIVSASPSTGGEYDSALTYDCQDLPIGHRRNAALLSRTPTLSPPREAELRTLLRDFDPDLEMDRVDHSPKCERLRDSEGGVHLSPDTVPNFLSTVADGLQDAGTAVIDGIIGIGDVISSAVDGTDNPDEGDVFEIGIPLTNEGEGAFNGGEGAFNEGEGTFIVSEGTFNGGDPAFDFDLRNPSEGPNNEEETFRSEPTDLGEGFPERRTPAERLTSPTSHITPGDELTTSGSTGGTGSSNTMTTGSGSTKSAVPGSTTSIKSIPEYVNESENEIGQSDDYIRSVVDIMI